jgi:NAD(P)-dependent dehydrogenase (short-subunit alcohol dehydrogenase family)
VRAGSRPVQRESRRNCLEIEAKLVHRRQERPHRASRSGAFFRQAHGRHDDGGSKQPRPHALPAWFGDRCNPGSRKSRSRGLGSSVNTKRPQSESPRAERSRALRCIRKRHESRDESVEADNPELRFGERSVMPGLHGFQIKEAADMNSPVVLITGALTGIGRAAAITFAQEGAKVVVSGRREKEGRELAAELKALGAEAIFVRTDVRNDDDVRKLVDQTVSRFGRLDIAVNNAGTEGTPGPVTEQTAESFAATFDTNVLGTLLSMKHELRAMLPQGSGSIVNVSSAYGSVGAAGASVYVASKHAVEGLTKSAALEVAGTGVRVNVVAPGTTDTGMLTRFTSTDRNKAALVSTVPLKRLATPEEIAHVIAFVASANASYMTGASIPVDGGMIAE